MNLKLQTKMSHVDRLELSIAEAPMPEPGPKDAVVRVEATPMNPSDLAVLLAGADVGSAQVHHAGVYLESSAKSPAKDTWR